MKFSIYFRTNGELVKLYEINRSQSGFYFHAFGNRPHFTYHTDGKAWFRHPSLNNVPGFNVKKQRTPLQEFVGPESITSVNILDHTKRIKKHTVKPEDIVIDIDPPFCVEIILSKNEAVLPETPDRLNLQQFFKRDFSPMIVVEAFTLVDRKLVLERFRINHPEIT